MKRFERLRDARKELERQKIKQPYAGLAVYDLKKNHPRMKKRYLVGSYYDYLEF